MRDEVLMELVDRALTDEQFRNAVRDDPDSALSAHGFELQPDELEAVKDLQRQTAGMSDDELREAITAGPRRQGT
jgi:hypothetical protein